MRMGNKPDQAKNDRSDDNLKGYWFGLRAWLWFAHMLRYAPGRAEVQDA